ncbi:hypothetical protein H0H81_006687, partial [Sphagnurus paluster]
MQPVSPKDEAILQVFQQILTRLEQLRPPDHQQREIECYFCSATGHRIRECPQVEPSIQTGRCKRDAEDRIVLPSGARVPNNVPGKNLRDKIEGCYRRSAGQPATSPIHTSKGTDTPSTCTPSSGLAAFDLDRKIYLFEQEVQKLDSRKFAKNAPSHVSTSAPYEPPPRVHMPYAPAPVSVLHTVITPWSAPAESSTTPTPVKFTRASRNFKPINYPERLPTPPATTRPPPYSKPSTPRQPITIRALSIESTRPVGRSTTVPAATALPPTEPSPPFSPASSSPSDRSNPTPVKFTSSPPSFGHP